MNKSNESLYKSLREVLEERSKPFSIALQEGNDRATAIISACLLDNLLERLIRAFYVKDPTVGMLFKTDHILQSFFSKIHIAYFSGLIPQSLASQLPSFVIAIPHSGQC